MDFVGQQFNLSHPDSAAAITSWMASNTSAGYLNSVVSSSYEDSGETFLVVILTNQYTYYPNQMFPPFSVGQFDIRNNLQPALTFLENSVGQGFTFVFYSGILDKNGAKILTIILSSEN